MLVFLIIGCLSTAAHAQEMQVFEEYGVGPRDSAMGSAFVGVADDFSAAFYNPAGLAQVEGLHATFGYKLILPKVTLKIPGYSADYFTDYPYTNFGLVGLATDLNVPSIVNPKYTAMFNFGMAFGISDFIHSYTNYYEQYTPYFFRYQDRPVALLPLYLALSVKPLDWFSFGGGLVMAPSTTYMDCRVRTDIYLPEGNSVASQGLVNRAYSLIEPLAGIMFRIPLAGMSDRLRVGLVWRDEVQVLDGKGPALNKIYVHLPGTDKTLSPIPPMNVPVVTLSGFTPMQAALGIAYKPTDGLLLATDTVWKRWSTWLNYFLVRPDPPFHDTVEQHVGLEQRFFTDEAWLEYWALRAGWYYQPKPTPSENNEWNILDNNTHVMSTGFGLRLDEILGVIKTPVNFDANFQLHYLVPETIANTEDRYPPLKTGGLAYSGTVAFELAW